MTNTNFEFNIGDEVVLIFGWSLRGGEKVPIKGFTDTVLDRRIGESQAEYFLKSLNNWVPAEMLLSTEKQDTTISEDDLVINPLNLTFPELAKKASSVAKVPSLPVANIKGVEVNVIEHFKDIKEYCENYELFGRWYNRNQFLKYIIGTFEDNGEESEAEEGVFGTLLGSLSGENSDYCWCIEIYDTDLMTVEQLEAAADMTGSFDSGFFLKDKAGKIYFVFTDID